jgi:hypothetical protein
MRNANSHEHFLASGDDSGRPTIQSACPTKLPSRPVSIVTIGLVYVVGLGCASSPGVPSDPTLDEVIGESLSEGAGIQVLRVMASDGISEKDLGRPCDEKFHFIAGEAGQPIFAASTETRRHLTTVAGYVQFGHTRELDLTLGVWGVDVGAGSTREQRYGIYRMYETSKVVEVDDRGKDPTTIPEGAQWYVGAIFFGYSVEEIAWGDSQSLHAGIAAKLATRDLGHFHAVVKQYALGNDIRARGLVGNNQQLQAIQSLADLASYQRAPTPVPILVEYRSIPGVQPDLGEAIDLAPIPPAFYRYAVQLESVHVSEPRQCPSNCNVVVRVQSSRSTDDGVWTEIAGPRGTSDPPFGGKEIIPSATAEDLRQGFRLQVQDNSPGFPGLGLCQFALSSAELARVANATDRILEIQRQCAPFTVLNLRLLAKEDSATP